MIYLNVGGLSLFKQDMQQEAGYHHLPDDCECTFGTEGAL